MGGKQEKEELEIPESEEAVILTRALLVRAVSQKVAKDEAFFTLPLTFVFMI